MRRAPRHAPIANEMHAGFTALRDHMPMNLRRLDLKGKGRGPGVDDDIARICEIWRDCHSRYGAGGDFLFGAFCAADAMYAPVVTRLDTYGVDLDTTCAAYSRAVLTLPAFVEWRDAALQESMDRARRRDRLNIPRRLRVTTSRITEPHSRRIRSEQQQRQPKAGA